MIPGDTQKAGVTPLTEVDWANERSMLQDEFFRLFCYVGVAEHNPKASDSSLQNQEKIQAPTAGITAKISASKLQIIGFGKVIDSDTSIVALQYPNKKLHTAGTHTKAMSIDPK